METVRDADDVTAGHLGSVSQSRFIENSEFVNLEKRETQSFPFHKGLGNFTSRSVTVVTDSVKLTWSVTVVTDSVKLTWSVTVVTDSVKLTWSGFSQ